MTELLSNTGYVRTNDLPDRDDGVVSGGRGGSRVSPEVGHIDTESSRDKRPRFFSWHSGWPRCQWRESIQPVGYPTPGGCGDSRHEAGSLEPTVVSQLSHESLIIRVETPTFAEGVNKNDARGDPNEFHHSPPRWTRESPSVRPKNSNTFLQSRRCRCKNDAATPVWVAASPAGIQLSQRRVPGSIRVHIPGGGGSQIGLIASEGTAGVQLGWEVCRSHDSGHLMMRASKKTSIGLPQEVLDGKIAKITPKWLERLELVTRGQIDTIRESMKEGR